MSPRSQIDLDGRDRLVQATVTVLITRGLAAVNPETICAAAGLERDEFARNFGSLDEVFVAVVTRLFDVHAKNPAGAVSADLSLAAALRKALRPSGTSKRPGSTTITLCMC